MGGGRAVYFSGGLSFVGKTILTFRGLPRAHSPPERGLTARNVGRMSGWILKGNGDAIRLTVKTNRVPFPPVVRYFYFFSFSYLSLVL